MLVIHTFPSNSSGRVMVRWVRSSVFQAFSHTNMIQRLPLWNLHKKDFSSKRLPNLADFESTSAGSRLLAHSLPALYPETPDKDVEWLCKKSKWREAEEIKIASHEPCNEFRRNETYLHAACHSFRMTKQYLLVWKPFLDAAPGASSV